MTGFVLLLQVEWPRAGHTLAQDIPLSIAHQVAMKPLRQCAPIWTAGIVTSDFEPTAGNDVFNTRYIEILLNPSITT